MDLYPVEEVCVDGAAAVDEAVLELAERGVDGVLRRPPRPVGHHVDRLRRLVPPNHPVAILLLHRDLRRRGRRLVGRRVRPGRGRRRRGPAAAAVPYRRPLQPPPGPVRAGPRPPVQLRAPSCAGSAGGGRPTRPAASAPAPCPAPARQRGGVPGVHEGGVRRRPCRRGDGGRSSDGGGDASFALIIEPNRGDVDDDDDILDSPTELELTTRDDRTTRRGIFSSSRFRFVLATSRRRLGGVVRRAAFFMAETTVKREEKRGTPTGRHRGWTRRLAE